MAAVVLLTLVTMTGCGTAPAPGSGGAHGGTRSATPGPGNGPAKVDLAITFSGGRGVRPAHWTLRCDPPGGTYPRAATACRDLLRLHRPFAPRVKQVACPMIMGAGGRIVVTGTWFAEPVHRVILDGGCDFGLFGTLSKILR